MCAAALLRGPHLLRPWMSPLRLSYDQKSLLCNFMHLSTNMTLLQNINLSFPSSKFSVLLSFAKYEHSSMCSCVSDSPVLQCLHCILPVHSDDLLPFMLSIIFALYLNQILAFAVVNFAR